MTTLYNYYYLTKPGIIYGNLLTVIGGFVFASRGHTNLALLFYTMAGTSLIIASACVTNNYIDRDIDKKMSRTDKRALVIGTVSKRNSLIYSAILGVSGVLVLGLLTNLLVLSIGIFAYIVYVIFYGVSKRRSVHGTLVGSFSGAAPIIGGYCAVTGSIDLTTGLLFALMIIWQMAHFYAIAIYRLKDYKAASLPVLPAIKGVARTKTQIKLYIVLLLIPIIALHFYSYAGYVFTLTMTGLTVWWLYFALTQDSSKNSTKWARSIFLRSLVLLLALALTLSVNNFLF